MSDHCPITLTLHSFIVTQPGIQLQAFNPPKWSRDIEENFVKSLDTANFINVNNLLSQVSPQDNSIDNTDKLNNAITSFTDNLLLLVSKNNRKSKRTIPKRKINHGLIMNVKANYASYENYVEKTTLG